MCCLEEAYTIYYCDDRVGKSAFIHNIYTLYRNGEREREPVCCVLHIHE